MKPKVVILCGGRGARFREETELKPKPMIDIGGRPLLWHLMKYFASFGYREFVLCLGYKGHVIKDYFVNYEARNNDCTVFLGRQHRVVAHGAHDEADWRVTLVDTGEAAMTGARVKRIQRFIPRGADFLLTYGDGLSDVDLGQLQKRHRQEGRIGTITAVHQPSRFGALEIQGRRVKRFREKSAVGQGLINGGFFYFNYRFFNYLRDADDCVLEREPLEGLARDGQLAVHEHPGFWQCMDTYRDWEVLQGIWQEGRAPWQRAARVRRAGR